MLELKNLDSTDTKRIFGIFFQRFFAEIVDVSKIKTVLVLKGVISETTSLWVLTCQMSSFYNDGQNILRLFNDLPNFPFTTSETKNDY